MNQTGSWKTIEIQKYTQNRNNTFNMLAVACDKNTTKRIVYVCCDARQRSFECPYHRRRFHI